MRILAIYFAIYAEKDTSHDKKATYPRFHEQNERQAPYFTSTSETNPFISIPSVPVSFYRDTLQQYAAHVVVCVISFYPHRIHFSPFPLVADITEDKVTNRTARLTVVFLIENNTDVYQPGLFAVFHPDILERHILHPVLVARTHGHHSTVIVVILIHVQHVYVAEPHAAKRLSLRGTVVAMASHVNGMPHKMEFCTVRLLVPPQNHQRWL